MIFDAILFDGENPFDAGENANFIRLNDLKESEVITLNDIVSRNPYVGLFFYISKEE